MKFVAYKGSDTYAKLDELFNRITDCQNRAVEFSKSLGFEGFSSYPHTLYTRIHSFIGKTKPEGYKSMGEGFYPKATKANAELIAQINALPFVKQDELS